METIEQLSARSETLSKLNGAMSALTTIDTSAWTDSQKLLLADVLWPLGELVDTVLEVQS